MSSLYLCHMALSLGLFQNSLVPEGRHIGRKIIKKVVRVPEGRHMKNPSGRVQKVKTRYSKVIKVITSLRQNMS